MIHENFKNKSNRDIRAKELERLGYDVRVQTFSNQSMHPMYIKDYGKEISLGDRGFGNTVYQTRFAKVYSLDAIPGNGTELQVISRKGNKTVSRRVVRRR